MQNWVWGLRVLGAVIPVSLNGLILPGPEKSMVERNLLYLEFLKRAMG
jgi:hypothetical protein